MMVLFEVVNVLHDGEPVEGLINTGQEFRSHESFISYAKRNGEKFIGRTWQLWSGCGKKERMEFRAIKNYKTILAPIEEGDKKNNFNINK